MRHFKCRINFRPSSAFELLHFCTYLSNAALFILCLSTLFKQNFIKIEVFRPKKLQKLWAVWKNSLYLPPILLVLCRIRHRRRVLIAFSPRQLAPSLKKWCLIGLMDAGGHWVGQRVATYKRRLPALCSWRIETSQTSRVQGLATVDVLGMCFYASHLSIIGYLLSSTGS